MSHTAELEQALSHIGSPSLRAPLRAIATGRVAANVGLMQLFIAAASEAQAEAALTGLIRELEPNLGNAAQRLGQALGVWARLPNGFATVKSVIAVDNMGADGSGRACAADIATLFDRAADCSPEASVALYSLGSGELLREATRELIARMHQWRLLSPTSVILDLGCGIGRMIEALAGQVGFVVGLDISSNMLQAAQRRAGSASRVALIRTSGQDLAAIADGSIDVICAVDSFPYIVRLGPEPVRRHVCEAQRVLKSGGALLILNFSYRGDLSRDRAEIAELARDCGFAVLRNGTCEFTTWDAPAFQLTRR